MGSSTAIQWTDKTFNGWWGCTKVGPGCDHCYADAFDRRTGGAHWGTGVARRRTSATNWNEPRRWEAQAIKTGYRPWVFASSMCDVFDNEVPDEWRTDLFGLIRETPHLRWQLLTKRIGNVMKMVPAGWPIGFEHVGVMATIVNQEEMDRDGPKLMDVTAAWRGISYEPALDILTSIPAVDWLIIGGESGPRSRPFRREWAGRALKLARQVGAAPFVKQMGAFVVDRNDAGFDGCELHSWDLRDEAGQLEHDIWGYSEEYQGADCRIRLTDKKGGDWSEWPQTLRVREFPPMPPVGSWRVAA